MASPRAVRCPQCRKVGDWFAGEFGPFCSRRCRLIDLGKWLGEDHAISGPLPPGEVDAAPPGCRAPGAEED